MDCAAATFAAIAGAKPAADRLFGGINLLLMLTGEKPEQPRTLAWRIARTARQQKALQHGLWKYLQESNVEILFELASDIGECHDVSFQNPTVFADLKQRHAAWEAEFTKE